MSTPDGQLNTARTELAQCRAQGNTLAFSMDDSQWSLRPPKGGWSPAECFAHLNLTTASMLPLLEAAAREARANHWLSSGPFHTGFFARALCWFLEPPYRMKIATQPVFVPGGQASKSEILKDWDESHAALDTFIGGCTGLSLDKPKITSPFDPKGRMQYSAYSALLILAAHERRHLWQAACAAGRDC